MIEKYLETNNNHIIYIKIWESKNPRGIVQILHGMREYIERYEEFALFMVRNGYTVIGHDHRGHGKSMKNSKTGYFADELGWDKVVSDVMIVNEYITNEFKNLDIYILGHSMGSFILRDFLYSYKNEAKIKGAIISGTGNPKKIIASVGLILANIILIRNDNFYESKFMETLAFYGYDKHFKNADVKSWLTRDVSKLIEFSKYKFSFKSMPIIFYRDLCFGIRKILKQKHFNISVPLMVISGSEDPVGNYGKDIKKVINNYSKYSNVESHLYENYRHEILNEIGREIVFKDILNWLNK